MNHWSDRLSALIVARPRLWRVGVGVVLALVLGVVLVRYLDKIAEPSRDPVNPFNKSAFLRWRPQIEDLDRGIDIYATHNYPNPPVMALVLRPFVALPPVTGAVTWLLVKAGLAAVMVWWVLRLAGEKCSARSASGFEPPLAERAEHFPPLAACVVGVLSIHPLLGDLQHGNVNIFIAFLVFASLELFRRGWDLTAGVVLALSIACKVTPALFVAYFGWKVLHAGWVAVRHRTDVVRAAWKGGGAVLLGTLVGLGVWLFAVPGAVLGFERNTQLLRSWYTTMVEPFVKHGKVQAEIANQSVPGVAHGFFTGVPLPGEEDGEDDGKPSKRRGTLFDLGPAAAGWMVRGCQGVFVLALVLLARERLDLRRQGVRVAAELAFVALGMLLFSERTWKHHATTTALPVAALVGFWVFGPSAVWPRRAVFGLLAAATVLMTGPSLLPDKWQEGCLEGGTHTAAFVLLTVAVGVVMWAEGRKGFTAEGT